MLFCNVFLQCSQFVLCFFSSFRIVHDACSFTCIVLSCNFHHKFPMHLLMMLNMMFIVFYTLFHNAHNKSFKTFCFVLWFVVFHSACNNFSPFHPLSIGTTLLFYSWHLRSLQLLIFWFFSKLILYSLFFYFL
jgi:hypothetical protein